MQVAGQFLAHEGADFLSSVGVFLSGDGSRIVGDSGERIREASGTFRVVGRFLSENVSGEVGQFLAEDFADATEDIGQFLSTDGRSVTQDVGVFIRDDMTGYTRTTGDFIENEANSILLAFDVFALAASLQAPNQMTLRRLPMIVSRVCGVIDEIDTGETIRVVGSVLGDVVNGSPLWYRVTTADDQVGFVHSGDIDVDPMTLATSTDRLPTIQELDTGDALGFGRSVDDSYRTNVRRCASTTSCELIGQLVPNESFIIYGVAEGSVYRGSRQWYMISYRENVGFVHAERTYLLDELNRDLREMRSTRGDD